MERQRLTREQKESMLILQAGSFLEYFELMLYVHMAFLLNELFFPQGDPHTTSLLSALAFCATFVFRPVGALIFGFIGDRFGRKQTIVFTTLLMAISCLMMANLPTYAEIGITAAWLVMLCRALQSISSLGEIIGAELYLTETVKPPLQYPVVSSIGIAAAAGGVAALGVASLVTTSGYNWRTAFWGGAIIACVGTAARTRLRETPDFVDMRRRVKRALEDANENGLAAVAALLVKNNQVWKVKVPKVTLLSFFLVFCGSPLGFYLIYIYCAELLQSKFGFTAAEVIQHNLQAMIVEFIGVALYTALSYKIHPLKILKFKSTVFLVIILSSPYILTHLNSPTQLFCLQAMVALFSLDDVPSSAVLYNHFPVFRRFTCVSGVFAASRAIMYVITSFGLVYLTSAWGYCGLWVIALPVWVGFFFGVRHFDRLENLVKLELKNPPWKLSPEQQAA